MSEAKQRYSSVAAAVSLMVTDGIGVTLAYRPQGHRTFREANQE